MELSDVFCPEKSGALSGLCRGPRCRSSRGRCHCRTRLDGYGAAVLCPIWSRPASSHAHRRLASFCVSCHHRPRGDIFVLLPTFSIRFRFIRVKAEGSNRSGQSIWSYETPRSWWLKGHLPTPTQPIYLATLAFSISSCQTKKDNR